MNFVSDVLIISFFGVKSNSIEAFVNINIVGGLGILGIIWMKPTEWRNYDGSINAVGIEAEPTVLDCIC